MQYPMNAVQHRPDLLQKYVVPHIIKVRCLRTLLEDLVDLQDR